MYLVFIKKKKFPNNHSAVKVCSGHNEKAEIVKHCTEVNVLIKYPLTVFYTEQNTLHFQCHVIRE